MPKYLLAAVAAASFLCVSPASAATTIIPRDNAAPGTALDFTGGAATATFTGSYTVDNTEFADTFFFSLDQFATLTAGNLSTLAGGSQAPFKGDLDINFVNLASGATTLFSFTKSASPPGTDKNEEFGLPSGAQGLLFAPGSYSLNLSGLADNVSASSRAGDAGPGSYNGSLSFAAAAAPTAPVPEPATWAMMLVGFGAVGFGMRRRRGDRRHPRVRFAI